MNPTARIAKTSPTNATEISRIDLRPLELVTGRGPAYNFRRIVIACEVFGDFLATTIAVILAHFLYGSFKLGKHAYYPPRTVSVVAFAFAMIVVLMLDRVGAYRKSNSLLRVRETEQVLRVSAQALLMVFVVSFFANVLFSRWLLVLCAILVPLLLTTEKSVLYFLFHAFHSAGLGNEKVLIYGSGSTGRRVFSALRRSPKLGLDPVAFVDDDLSKAGSLIFEFGYEPRRPAPVIPGPVDKDMLARSGADLLIIAIPSLGGDRFHRTIEAAFGANARVAFVPSHFLPSDPWIAYQDIDGVLLASFGKPGQRILYDVSKRLCDVLGTLLLTVLGAPVFLLLALMIKIDSEGPILFCQERVGQGGRRFIMYKFRTMQSDVPPYEYSPRASHDPRITRMGKFLRKTSLDEIPQLLNVLRGHMSLVGPRPEMPFIVEEYAERHRQRLQVKPGITGLWQLSGDRRFLIHENVEYDLYYIQHRNFFMDLAILLHTSIFAMRGI